MRAKGHALPGKLGNIPPYPLENIIIISPNKIHMIFFIWNVLINNLFRLKFFAISQKVLVSVCLLTFLTNTYPRDSIPSAWVVRHTAWMPYFTFTRLYSNLDLLPVFGFQHFIFLERLQHNTRKQFAQVMQRNFAYMFAQTRLKGIFTIFVFLEIFAF